MVLQEEFSALTSYWDDKVAERDSKRQESKKSGERSKIERCRLSCGVVLVFKVALTRDSVDILATSNYISCFALVIIINVSITGWSSAYTTSFEK